MRLDRLSELARIMYHADALRKILKSTACKSLSYLDGTVAVTLRQHDKRHCTSENSCAVTPLPGVKIL